MTPLLFQIEQQLLFAFVGADEEGVVHFGHLTDGDARLVAVLGQLADAGAVGTYEFHLGDGALH